MTTTQIDPSNMTMEEFRAAQDREDGRGRLRYRSILGTNIPVVDVLDYTLNGEGQPVARVITELGDGRRGETTVPLASMFATKTHRPLGFKPVPWC